MLGNSEGGFGPALNYDAGNGPQVLAVGVFTPIANLDLAVVEDNFVVTMNGDGKGEFRQPVSYPVGPSPTCVAVADFNGDGLSDLVVTNSGSNSISILLHQPSGTGYQAPVNYAVGSKPSAVAVGDSNRDGIPDLAVATPALIRFDPLGQRRRDVRDNSELLGGAFARGIGRWRFPRSRADRLGGGQYGARPRYYFHSSGQLRGRQHSGCEQNCRCDCRTAIRRSETLRPIGRGWRVPF